MTTEPIYRLNEFETKFLKAKYDELMFLESKQFGDYIIFDFLSNENPFASNEQEDRFGKRINIYKAHRNKMTGPVWIVSELTVNGEYLTYRICSKRPDKLDAMEFTSLASAIEFCVLYQSGVVITEKEQCNKSLIVPPNVQIDVEGSVERFSTVCDNVIATERFLNSSWLNVTGLKGVLTFIYGGSSDPLRAGGTKSGSYEMYRKWLEEFVAEEDGPFYGNFDSHHVSRFITLTRKPRFAASMTIGPFNTVDELIGEITAGMNERGTYVKPEDRTAKPVEIDSWNLGKETYTRAEVIELMTMMKEELGQTNSQLFDRMLGRINKDKRS